MSIGDAFDAFNERVTLFLLRFVGPPQISSTRRSRPDPADDHSEAALRGRFERVVGPDGHPYLVERGAGNS